jgi:hypothetical protein
MPASHQSDVHTGSAGRPHLRTICSVTLCGRASPATIAEAEQMGEDARARSERVVDPSTVSVEDLREAIRGWQLFGDLTQQRDEALNKLLGYCKQRSAEVSGPGQGDDYGDVATRLSKILNGEN